MSNLRHRLSPSRSSSCDLHNTYFSLSPRPLNKGDISTQIRTSLSSRAQISLPPASMTTCIKLSCRLHVGPFLAKVTLSPTFSSLGRHLNGTPTDHPILPTPLHYNTIVADFSPPQARGLHVSTYLICHPHHLLLLLDPPPIP